MRVLYCHNVYQQPGGEDNCARDEITLLRSHGHDVFHHTLHNDAIHEMNKLTVAAKTVWNARSKREVNALLKKHRIDVLHAMNTFPLLSPAIYYAARRQGVAVVQSLQNYRLVCPGAYLMRDGEVCSDCLERRIPWPAIQHKCYRGSRSGSAVVATMLVTHRLIRTWSETVHRYITCTEFGKNIFVQGGFPAERIAVKPNFIDPLPAPALGGGGYALFVGRLSPEKGVGTLLDAWRAIPNPPPLKIVGDGPLRKQLAQSSLDLPEVEMLGWREPTDVARLMASAECLVLPSLWYEGFPKTQLEAMALGTPIIASNLGSMGETILPGRNGLLFETGNPAALAECVEQFFSQPDRLFQLRQTTREDCVEKYTAQRNYELLIKIYQQAINAVQH
jgi:glycosyltransferase involved in cell wall biosynthesis